MNATHALSPKPRVLIVDDEAGIRTVLERWSCACGADAVVASSADEALEIMREGPVELAVCDVRMPGHDGVWLVEQLRTTFPYTSVVLATAVPDLDPHVSLREGVVGYLVKPFERGDFETILAEGLADCERRRARAAASTTSVDGTGSVLADQVWFGLPPG